MNIRDHVPLAGLSSALADLRALLDGQPPAVDSTAFGELKAAAAAMMTDRQGRIVIEWLVDQTLRAPPVQLAPGMTIEQTSVQVIGWQARSALVRDLLALADPAP